MQLLAAPPNGLVSASVGEVEPACLFSMLPAPIMNAEMHAAMPVLGPRRKRGRESLGVENLGDQAAVGASSASTDHSSTGFLPVFHVSLRALCVCVCMANLTHVGENRSGKHVLVSRATQHFSQES